MSKIVHDFITAIKGIRGAGDTIRGEVMDATDRVFDNKFNHTETEAAQAKNRAIAEKGRQEMRDADILIGRRDFEPKDAAETGEASSTHHSVSSPTAAGGPTAPAPAAASHEGEKSSVN
ncbi:hypothetical protein F4820DRAFT_248637 [Hypoxylon rubiginosum]|uniref:Uncharacterized protein n=1 Tax=Hypoxylon rubiginosum TaxID=110542 RepID=A0ACB9Z531_9PEZI|nr:hypothetical protein F4820DRAFT_248637 [Hypoxylon rubiginosum]